MANYDEEIIGLKQQQELARRLRDSGIDQPEGQMVSGHYVAPSITQNLAQLFKAYLGRSAENSATEKIAALRADKEAKANQYMQDYQSMQGGAPVFDDSASRLASIGADGSGFDLPTQTGVTEAAPYSQQSGALMRLAEVDPQRAALAMQLQQFGDTRNDKLTLAREALAAREEAKQRDYTQQAQMAMLAASLRPAPVDNTLVSVIGPDGVTPTLVNRSQAAGMTPYNKVGGVGTPATRIQDANDAITILRQAAPLVNKSTSSGMGNLADATASFFGASTSGADAAAQLKVLGGALVSKMPKMTGPQSDKDVLLYKEMAGKLGDPTVPTSQKQAAMETINQLQVKYSGGEYVPLDFSGNPAPVMQQSRPQPTYNPASPVPAAGGWAIRPAN